MAISRNDLDDIASNQGSSIARLEALITKCHAQQMRLLTQCAYVIGGTLACVLIILWTMPK